MLFENVLRLEEAKVKSNSAVPGCHDGKSMRGPKPTMGKKSRVNLLLRKYLRALKYDTDPHRKDVLVALNNLALAFAQTGKVDQAIPLYQQTLKLMKGKLGPDDPSTLSCMYNLAMAFKVARRFDEAIPLFDETLRLRKEKFGPESDIAVRTMTCVGVDLWSRRKSRKMRRVVWGSAANFENAFGRGSPRHPVGHVAVRRVSMLCRPQQGGSAGV